MISANLLTTLVIAAITIPLWGAIWLLGRVLERRWVEMLCRSGPGDFPGPEPESHGDDGGMPAGYDQIVPLPKRVGD